MGLGFVLLALRGSGNTCLVGLGLVRLKISSSYVLHLTKIFSGSIINQRAHSKLFGTVLLLVCNSLIVENSYGSVKQE